MAEPFIFINTYRIRPDKAEAYREKFREVAEVVEAKEPRMLYFAAHESEDGTEASTVQVHADPDNLLFHMQLVQDYIREAMVEYLDPSSPVSIRIYGTPSDAILNGIRQLAGPGVSVTVSPAVVAFDRFPDA